MAVEAVVSVVIQKLTDMLNDQEPVGFDKEIVQKMKEIRSKLMRGFSIEAEENQGGDKAVKKWADEYLGILYNVEDIVETFAVGIARQRERRSNTRIGAFFNNYATPFFCFFNNLKAQKLGRQMARIGTKLDNLNNAKPGLVRGARSFKSLGSESSIQNGESHHGNQQNSFGHSGQAEEEQQQEEEEEIGGCIISTICPGETTAAEIPNRGSSFGERLRQPTLTSICSYEEEESGIVGLQEDVIELVERITSDEGDGSRSNVLAIVGAVGSGKTKLAQTIYKSKGIKKYFDCRAWVYVSQDYTKRDLLLSLLKQVESCKDQGVLNSEQMLVDRLSKLLEKKKYLVVIDDVRTGDDWDKLKDAFRNTGINGSKIIVTTCEEKVALSVDPLGSPHYMEGLTDQESWKMFLKKARLPETYTDSSQDPYMSELHPKILEICKGLPLWIVLLGGLLSTKKIRYEWSRVLDSLHPHPLNSILSSCYNDLRVHSKLCLLYMVLFPKEYDIPVRRLVRLWLAEGFVKRPSSLKRRPSGQKMPEDVAQEYFNDLVIRNMIEITKSRSDGSPRRCRLPGALHDNLLSKTQDIGLLHIHRNSSSCNTDATGPFAGLRRIVEYLNVKNCSLDFSRLQYLRSYISFNLQKKDIPATEVANFVSSMTRKRGFALLTVLDLEGVYKPSLPDKLGDLCHLRYLGLRWTFLDNLPPSVGDLTYLETLDLKHTHINSLPNSVWKLKHLRHLNLSGIRLDMPEQPHRTLTGLLTLWGLFVDDKSPIKNGLRRLQDLRELGITFTLSSSSSLDLADWISNLTTLQSLRLRSKDEMGRPSELHLKPLSLLQKLSHLNLLGNLQKLPDIQEFPPGLKVLTLSVSLLTDDPMPTLAQLQSLTVLRLLADSYQGEKIVCPRRGFSKLRVLKLWMLRNLEEWDIREGAMQNLKELNIRCCDRLRILPPSLLRLSTLEELTLTNMPPTFVAKVKQRKSPHTSLTVNKLNFGTLSPCEQARQCF